jgi:hypothetical protein
MSEFSTTRASDKATAISANSSIQTAISWLRSNTQFSRLSDLEVFEVIQWLLNNNFTITYSGTAITSAQTGS